MVNHKVREEGVKCTTFYSATSPFTLFLNSYLVNRNSYLFTGSKFLSFLLFFTLVTPGEVHGRSDEEHEKEIDRRVPVAGYKEIYCYHHRQRRCEQPEVLEYSEYFFIVHIIGLRFQAEWFLLLL